MSDDDHMTRELSDEEVELLDDLERGLRLRGRPQSLFVNVETSDMMSPSGTIYDGEIAGFERLHREAKEKYRRQFGEPPPDDDLPAA